MSTTTTPAQIFASYTTAAKQAEDALEALRPSVVEYAQFLVDTDPDRRLSAPRSETSTAADFLAKEKHPSHRYEPSTEWLDDTQVVFERTSSAGTERLMIPSEWFTEPETCKAVILARVAAAATAAETAAESRKAARRAEYERLRAEFEREANEETR